MKKLYVVAAICSSALAASTGYAQTNFQPGYVVRPAGDTVRGEVDYRDAHFNARQCRFRPAPGAAVAAFGPADVLAYGLRDGQHAYIRYI